MKKITILIILMTLFILATVSTIAYEYVISTTQSGGTEFYWVNPTPTFSAQEFKLPIGDVYITNFTFRYAGGGTSSNNITISLRTNLTGGDLANKTWKVSDFDTSTGNNHFFNFEPLTFNVTEANTSYYMVISGTPDVSFNGYYGTTSTSDELGLYFYRQQNYGAWVQWSVSPFGAQFGNSSIFYEDLPEPCESNWTPHYTTCSVGDNQTLLYNDTNACVPPSSSPPIDNGTVSSCNYCTGVYTENSPNCVTGDSTREITYDWVNYGTCCGVTGIPVDCNIPSNYTESCIGIHSSEDISNVVIDGLVEFGVAMIQYTPIIVIIGLATWILVI